MTDTRRTMIAIALALVVMTGFSALTGQSESKTIQANEIVLVDESGNKRVLITALGGSPRIHIEGKNGSSAVLGSLEGVGAVSVEDKANWSTMATSKGVTITDPEGRHRIFLAVDDEAGTGGLWVNDTGGNKSAAVYIDYARHNGRFEGNSMRLNNESGTAVIGMNTINGDAWIGIDHPNDNRSLRMGGYGGNSEFAFVAENKDGGSSVYDESGVALKAPDGQTKLMMIAGRKGGYLTIRDAKGKEVFSTPVSR